MLTVFIRTISYTGMIFKLIKTIQQLNYMQQTTLINIYNTNH